MATRSTPSAICGASCASTVSARAPPVMLSTIKTDAMTALGLALRHVKHMSKQPAKRRAQDM